eukprot:CAMPEP_0175861524 /NCGR_PEP_ID=MMETSP0107_2-20121207/31432_1 /TAXON_ID=195067 ORGANISM="Goniomonas pacifica, Strain CCMP1869" /NCGR_SAMPLE_ID=MMETSP0107_2 /ASSEMBLY_ACC=CAM_ASM_000203 /LENGTH=59 /DNA_ID=CAMNT_0017178411 /DNA_START=297 /DNA_END=472 /DNA_ORIENTATION=+
MPRVRNPDNTSEDVCRCERQHIPPEAEGLEVAGEDDADVPGRQLMMETDLAVQNGSGGA